MGRFASYFGVNYMLPEGQRLGDVPETRRLYREYLKVARPAAMQGLMINLMLSIDLIMIGGLGAYALAAVGILGQPKMIFLVLARSLAVAMTAMIARRYGEGDYEDMNAVLKQGLLLTLAVYLPLGALMIAGISFVVEVAGADASIVKDASLFGTYIVIGSCFTAVSQCIGAALIGTGKTSVIFKSAVTGNVVNTVLNFLLIYGMFGFPALGVEGAGIATMTGEAVGAGLLLAAVMRGKSGLSLRGRHGWKLTRDHGHSIYHIGGSALGEQIFERIGMFSYTRMVAMLGVVPLATHHVCMNLCDIAYYLSAGLGQANASFSGRNLGRRRPDMAALFGHVGVRVGLVLAAVSFAVYAVLREPLIRLYTDDPAVIALGSSIILIVAAASFPQALQMVYAGVLRGAGDARYVMKYSFGVIAIFRPVLTYLLCFTFGLGLWGAWLALIADQSSRMLFSGLRFYGGKWKGARA